MQRRLNSVFKIEIHLVKEFLWKILFFYVRLCLFVIFIFFQNKNYDKTCFLENRILLYISYLMNLNLSSLFMSLFLSISSRIRAAYAILMSSLFNTFVLLCFIKAYGKYVLYRQICMILAVIAIYAIEIISSILFISRECISEKMKVFHRVGIARRINQAFFYRNCLKLVSHISAIHCFAFTEKSVNLSYKCANIHLLVPPYVNTSLTLILQVFIRANRYKEVRVQRYIAIFIAALAVLINIIQPIFCTFRMFYPYYSWDVYLAVISLDAVVVNSILLTFLVIDLSFFGSGLADLKETACIKL